ncbi:TPA: hypothetical protein VJE07_001071 [Streptococcus pyogenes]|uniref:hypothetical protein n=1 Tax=Fusobacterium gonidiaformans TaxID=849 RepID=UPI002599A484|nr:hypothetical protein [uncultured Parvimonas sp.]HER0809429.1 hypothetical protein [Streptococcus pyogenes]
MKELENVISQLEKETKKKEQAENKIKQLRQKKSHLKRKADTQRKIKKGGVFESFEREITGRQEDTDNDLVYAFLDYVLSDNSNREKLKELTEIHLREQETGNVENENLYDENIRLEDEETQNTDKDTEN